MKSAWHIKPSNMWLTLWVAFRWRHLPSHRWWRLHDTWNLAICGWHYGWSWDDVIWRHTGRHIDDGVRTPRGTQQYVAEFCLRRMEYIWNTIVLVACAFCVDGPLGVSYSPSYSLASWLQYFHLPVLCLVRIIGVSSLLSISHDFPVQWLKRRHFPFWDKTRHRLNLVHITSRVAKYSWTETCVARN